MLGRFISSPHVLGDALCWPRIRARCELVPMGLVHAHWGAWSLQREVWPAALSCSAPPDLWECPDGPRGFLQVRLNTGAHLHRLRCPSAHHRALALAAGGGVHFQPPVSAKSLLPSAAYVGLEGCFVLGWCLFGASLIQARYWVQAQWPVKKRLLYLIFRLLQAGSAKVIVVGRGKGHPQRGSSSAGMLLSCSIEGHLELCGVSNAAVCMPFPQIPLWAAGPKLHPKQEIWCLC